MVASLQQGIYHARGQRPGPAFSILFLRADRHLDAPEVGRAFGSLWEMYQGLARGVVRDLPDHPVPHGDLSVLVGYGRNVFDLAGVRRRQPPNLKEFGLFRSPLTTGGGPLLIGGGLRYASDVRTNPATEDIAVQFIGANQLAVRRAIVETWKLLHDTIDPAIDAPPLQLTGFYTGFQRDDGRSWIDFHDGVSNMRSEERLGAIAAKRSPEPADRWMEGGTYLVFIRLAVDLLAWRRLDRAQQEMLVGRDKLSGCSLVAIGPDRTSVAEQGCPGQRHARNHRLWKRDVSRCANGR